jgi:hypothetical protein
MYSGIRNKIWNPMWYWDRLAVCCPAWGSDFLDTATGRGFFAVGFPWTYVYASPEAQSDTVADRLAQVAPDSACRIHVMQNRFKERPQVVDQLVRLRQGGCQVHVLLQYKAGTDEGDKCPREPEPVPACTDESTVWTLRTNNIPINVSTDRLIHDKTILIYGRMNSMSAGYHVLAGSHNLAIGALRNNDELLVHLRENPTAHAHYLQHFLKAFNTPGLTYLCQNTVEPKAPSKYCSTSPPPTGSD